MPTLGSMVNRSLIVCLHASFKSVARSHPKSTWLPGELLQPACEVGGGGQMTGDTPPKACSCARVMTPLAIKTLPAGVA